MGLFHQEVSGLRQSPAFNLVRHLDPLDHDQCLGVTGLFRLSLWPPVVPTVVGLLREASSLHVPVVITDLLLHACYHRQRHSVVVLLVWNSKQPHSRVTAASDAKKGT